ncbi:unnamed protein product [Ceratitis capitata]|uniref:(Mediterranean fruit fly) hypothetical protein n=1 Tax=Ceratitis capitata TaxID=7213 RepID=A0A811VGW1_CERCA|nr:unnamed protein product [Ceratitis capitata]
MISATPFIRQIYLSANTLCLIIGLIMTLLCVFFMDSVQNLHLIYCIFGLIVGALTVFSALVGYRAIKPPKAAWMWLYFALLAILFVIQMYVVIQYEASSIVATTLEEVESLWKRELVKEGPMADIESRFHCCGLHNSSDYITLNLPLPASCFYTENNAWTNYNEGCLEKVKFAADRASNALSFTGSALAAAQLVALVFSFILTLLYHRRGDYEILS